MTNNEYKKALVYCRVSSERQVKEGTGLDSQEQRCLAHAKAKGLAVARIFRDEGISGGLFDRPAMKKLIAYLDQYPNEKFVIIFDDLKRFARDLEIHLKLRSEFISRGARLDCLNFNFEDSPEGIFVENIIAATAQLEREQNRRQVIQKQKSRLENGYWSFHAPTGLKFEKHPTHGKILVPDETIAPIYKEAIEKYKDFELNTLDQVKQFVLSKCKQYGIKKQFALNGAYRMLTNPLYAGYIAYEPWDVSFREARHTGFISIETYNAVQEKLSNRAKPRLRKDYKEDFPLRNYVICPQCIKPMTASWHKSKSGKRYPHYWCKTDSCIIKNKTIPRDRVETEFIKILKQYTPRQSVIRLAEAVFNDVWDQRQNYQDQHQMAINKEVQAIDIRIKTFIDRIASATNEAIIKHYEIEIENLSNKKTALSAGLNKQRYLEDDFLPAFKYIFKYLENPVKVWALPDYREKRNLLNMFCERGLVFSKENGFGTPQMPLLISTLSRQDTSKSDLVEMAGVKPASKKRHHKNCSQA